MRRLFKLLISLGFLSLALAPACFAGFVYQDFEPHNGSDEYGWSWNAKVGFSNSNEPVHSGRRSWKVISDNVWGGTGIASQVSPWNIDFDVMRNDRLVFWIYSLPEGEKENNVGVKFFDNGAYKAQGFEVWTTQTAFYGEWTELKVLFSQLPQDFNLKHINKIEFVNYWPGIYYFDDICVIRKDRVYQAFEPQLRAKSTISEYGWVWDKENDTVNFAQQPEPVAEGLHSWKLTAKNKWSGTGIQSQEQKLSGSQQDFWHVDLAPNKNDRLLFWAYGLPQNLMDNNIGIQFYDHARHADDDTKIVVWPKKAGCYGNWTRFTVLFNELPQTLNLRDLNKIQFQEYWPGIYYLDDIRATATLLEINELILPKGLVSWNTLAGAGEYILEESRVMPEGPWVKVYSGNKNWYRTNRLSKAWYRVRWQEKKSNTNSIPYLSDYSDAVEYNPPALFIIKDRLKEGFVEWPCIAQANLYEVEIAQRKEGPWSLIYRGPFRSNWLKASYGVWYRVRGLRQEDGVIIDATNWSRAQAYRPGKGFLKAKGTAIKDEDGKGKEVLLQGVNLGSLFLIEKWMTGIGELDKPPIEDEWTIREVLNERFGYARSRYLLETFYNSYVRSFDFDSLLNIGVNVVRVPVYYRLDFHNLDRIIKLCADRGIYVLIDLHGAPGCQNNEAHSGRINFNKLFEDSREGATYRNRTVQLWKEIAQHYKDNPAVCGFDLLNEPTGAPSKEALWKLYDRIYKAIRGVDKNHMIVMEGIWDWDTLPNPLTMGWKNIVYQFHYYLWNYDEDFQAHKAFIDEKIAQSRIKQAEYNVPVMIGEFTGFSLKPIWDYYLKNFNLQKWSWMMWSYKTHQSPSEWGLYNHSRYDAELPKLREDSFYTLYRKFQRYATANYHSINYTLSEIIKDYLVQPQP